VRWTLADFASLIGNIREEGKGDSRWLFGGGHRTEQKKKTSRKGRAGRSGMFLSEEKKGRPVKGSQACLSNWPKRQTTIVFGKVTGKRGAVIEPGERGVSPRHAPDKKRRYIAKGVTPVHSTQTKGGGGMGEDRKNRQKKLCRQRKLRCA